MAIEKSLQAEAPEGENLTAEAYATLGPRL